MTPLELWGGVECTINRVGDRYMDQLALARHAERPGDIDRFAALGFRALRYPILWERVAPAKTADGRWQAADRDVERMQRLGVTPIVGLLHHGSGPPYTHLLDPLFAARFADFAGRVARRYPHIKHYTPINEPLTTARFSGLYGIWYPHLASDRSFLRILANECLGIVLAMTAIRAVQPEAQLVMTEDLGQASSGPALAYQARFENERRWLSLDLLCGRVKPGHRLYRWIRRNGFPLPILNRLAEEPCPPSLIAINHYVTSDRFLDPDLSRYPADMHGGNRRHRYVDIEAVRTPGGVVPGRSSLLRQTWERYGRPVAIGESHMACTREEQLRWLQEAWDGAQAARAQGVPVRAVTQWALLGSFDWRSLCTRPEGCYEPGVYDLRSGEPRPTALARLVRSLADGGGWKHPAMEGDGWWRRSIRFEHPPAMQAPSVRCRQPGGAARPVLITGGHGRLALAFQRACECRGLRYVMLSRQDLDITQSRAVAAALRAWNPWAVINAAGFSSIDRSESNPLECHRGNLIGPTVLAEAAAARRIAFLFWSTDQVFGGDRNRAQPYLESHPSDPVNLYGQCHAYAEVAVQAVCRRALIVRTGPIFNPWSADDTTVRRLRRWQAGGDVAVAQDLATSPVCAPDAVNAAIDLLIDEERGIWHLAHRHPLPEFEWIRHLGARLQLDGDRLRPVQADAASGGARRPAYSVLASERGGLLPPTVEALDRSLALASWQLPALASSSR